MNSKVFSQRFNREISVLSLPDELSEKTRAVAKVFGISRHLANGMLLGHALPSDEQLHKIARELEVCPEWLCGRADKKRAYPA